MDEFTSAEQALVVVHHVVETIGPDDLHRPRPVATGMCRPSPTISSTPSSASVPPPIYRPLCRKRIRSADASSKLRNRPWQDGAAADWPVKSCSAGDPAHTPRARHPVPRTPRPRLGFRRSPGSPFRRSGRPRRTRARPRTPDPHGAKPRHRRIRPARAGPRRRQRPRPAHRLYRTRPAAARSATTSANTNFLSHRRRRCPAGRRHPFG